MEEGRGGGRRERKKKQKILILRKGCITMRQKLAASHRVALPCNRSRVQTTPLGAFSFSVITARIGESITRLLFTGWRVFGVVCLCSVFCVMCSVLRVRVRCSVCCVSVRANSDTGLRYSAVTKNAPETDWRAQIRCFCISIRLLFWRTDTVLSLISINSLIIVSKFNQFFNYNKHKVYSQFFGAICLIKNHTVYSQNTTKFWGPR